MQAGSHDIGDALDVDPTINEGLTPPAPKPANRPAPRSTNRPLVPLAPGTARVVAIRTWLPARKWQAELRPGAVFVIDARLEPSDAGEAFWVGRCFSDGPSGARRAVAASHVASLRGKLAALPLVGLAALIEQERIGPEPVVVVASKPENAKVLGEPLGVQLDVAGARMSPRPLSVSHLPVKPIHSLAGSAGLLADRLSVSASANFAKQPQRNPPEVTVVPPELTGQALYAPFSSSFLFSFHFLTRALTNRSRSNAMATTQAPRPLNGSSQSVLLPAGVAAPPLPPMPVAMPPPLRGQLTASGALLAGAASSSGTVPTSASPRVGAIASAASSTASPTPSSPIASSTTSAPATIEPTRPVVASPPAAAAAAAPSSGGGQDSPTVARVMTGRKAAALRSRLSLPPSMLAKWNQEITTMTASIDRPSGSSSSGTTPTTVSLTTPATAEDGLRRSWTADDAEASAAAETGSGGRDARGLTRLLARKNNGIAESGSQTPTTTKRPSGGSKLRDEAKKSERKESKEEKKRLDKEKKEKKEKEKRDKKESRKEKN